MDVTSTALSGLRAAETRLGVAAQNTANANTEGFKQLQVTQSTNGDGSVKVDVVQTEQDVSLEEQVVNADIATYNFQANLKVLQKQREMEKSLLDIQA